jgi:malonate transporter and related proteins
LMDAAGVRGINDFTAKIAFPALLFGSIGGGKNFSSLGVASIYLVGCLSIYAAALWLARAALQAQLSRAAAFALNATYGSAAYVAMPIVTARFGQNGLFLILPIIALHSGVLLPLAAALIEFDTDNTGFRALRNTLRALLRNPIVMSIVLGFLWHVAGVPFPASADMLLGLLGKTAPGLALFCVGASLPMAAGGFCAKEAVLAALCKLALLPTVIAGLSFCAGLSGLPVKVALVTAAMPTGANAFLVARRAAGFADASARTVVITLVASLPLLSVLLWGLAR